MGEMKCDRKPSDRTKAGGHAKEQKEQKELKEKKRCVFECELIRSIPSVGVRPRAVLS